MKVRYSIYFVAASLLLANGSAYPQQYQPDDVMHAIGQHQLRYRHVLAYINIEMEGEDPVLLSDKEHIEELTQELLEEFAGAPEEVLNDLQEHWAAMQMGAGFETATPGSGAGDQSQKDEGPVSSADANANWKPMLTGSVLYYSKTESYDGLFVQSTQYMHLCPNGTAYTYQSSAGGGNVGGMGINSPDEMEFTGAVNWDVIEQDGAAYFQIAMGGTSQRVLPMRLVHNKILIQGLGEFYLQSGAAVCR
jgi:hypothetical protein